MTMKKFLLLLIISLIGFGQQLTYVPDDGFEKWIEESIIGADNGLENDNYVFTSALDCNENFYVGWANNYGCILDISNTYYPIFDLTGIQDFKISQLRLYETFISTLDLSNVEFIDNNNFDASSLSILGNNQYLESIILPEDTLSNISITLSSVENLSNLVFNPSLSFKSLILGYGLTNNSLCKLKVEGTLICEPNSSPIYITNCDNIKSYDFSGLYGASYQTTIQIYNSGLNPNTDVQMSLNNNTDFYNWVLYGFNNSGLSCVEVNSVEAANFYSNNNQWPEETNYSTNCFNYNFDCNSININKFSVKPKKLITKIDILGKENNNNEGFQLYIYDDGSVEKKYVIE